MVGDKCNYRCHCFSSTCSPGHCQPSQKCEKPYFGYYCQYENLIFKSNVKYDFASDGEVSTCNNVGSTLQFNFNQNMTFSFISLSVENVAIITESYKRKNITLNFKTNHDIFGCKHQEIWEISRTEIEIRCLNETVLFNELTLIGSSVKYICEIYLSGGRSTGLNLPVRGAGSYKENTINGIIHNEDCFFSGSSYEVTLTKSFQLYHIRIHNMPGHETNRMIGFRIRVKDNSDTNIIEHDFPEFYRHVYEIAITSQAVAAKVVIDNPHGSVYIALCEVEILGDCPPGMYGLDCDQSCVGKCPEGRCTINGVCYSCIREMGFTICRQSCSGCSEECHISNSICPGSCIHGYRGDHCLELCANCADTGQCDKIAGICSSFCAEGFMGVNCSQVCGFCGSGKCDKDSGNCTGCLNGYFGNRCTKRCHQCKDNYCDQATGNCLKGCHDGYRGVLCFLECSNCAGNRACDQMTGECVSGCKDGFKGVDCTEPCGHCTNQICQRENGTCTFGCLHGYVRHDCGIECSHCVDKDCDPGTSKCRKGCQDGYYGTNCVKSCPNCAGNRACDRYSGKCLYGCKSGYYTDTCNEECGNCDRDKSCEKLTGRCKYGCIEGFTGPRCRDHKNDLEDSKKFTVFLFYAVFLSFIVITLILLFFSQKIYWFCTSETRESFDALDKRLGQASIDQSIATTHSSVFSSGKSSSAGTYISSGTSSVDDLDIVENRAATYF